jgi:hypothetical protein
MSIEDDKNLSLEDKITEADKGNPVYISNEDEFNAINTRVVEKRKMRLNSESDYELQISVDKDKQVATYYIIEVKTGNKVAEGWSGSPKPLPLLRFRINSEGTVEKVELRVALSNLFHIPFKFEGLYKKEKSKH